MLRGGGLFARHVGDGLAEGGRSRFKFLTVGSVRKDREASELWGEGNTYRGRCFELTGIHPACIPSLRVPLVPRRGFLAAPLSHRRPSRAVRVTTAGKGLERKKRAGIFLSIPPGSSFFTLFFIPSPPSRTFSPPGPYHPPLPPVDPSRASCPDAGIFFFRARDSRRRLAEGRRRLQGKKLARDQSAPR